MNEIKLVSTMEQSISKNAAWCISFELAWKTFQQDILHNNFECLTNNAIIENLINSVNKQLFLDKNDYYVKAGAMNLELKKQIKKDLKNKFKTSSDILDLLTFDKEKNTNKYLVYSIIMLTLTFNKPFDYLYHNKEQPFNINENFDIKNLSTSQKVKYFGIDEKTQNDLKKQLIPLFYENDNNFAIKIKTSDKSKNIVLYRTDEIIDFKSAYEMINEQTKNAKYRINIGKFAVPNLNISTNQSFEELKNAMFKRKSDNQIVSIANTMQSLIFKLDNKGAKVKSEAVIHGRLTAYFDPHPIIKDFIFDKPFYLFIEVNNQPMVAIRVNDIEHFK